MPVSVDAMVIDLEADVDGEAITETPPSEVIMEIPPTFDGVDVAELFSPPRMCLMVIRLGLVAGFSYDLTTGTDLATWAGRAEAWSGLQNQRPRLLVCSPPARNSRSPGYAQG